MANGDNPRSWHRDIIVGVTSAVLAAATIGLFSALGTIPIAQWIGLATNDQIAELETKLDTLRRTATGGIDFQTVEARLDSFRSAVFAYDRDGCPRGFEEWGPGAGRVIIGVGVGEGLTPREYRDSEGVEAHQLTVAEMAVHSHELSGKTADHVADIASGPYSRGVRMTLGTTPESTEPSGRSDPHENMPPFIALYFCKLSPKE